MAISGQHKLSINQSGDNSEYLAVFHRQVLLLICEGCNLLKATGADYTNTVELNITGKVIHYTRLYIENPDSPEWVCPYSVHDDPPENDGKREGKGRKRVDIIVERTQRGKHPRIRFEAKRLKKPGFSVGMYVGQEGIGEFIAGNYARNDKVAGMLGYVQSDDCGYWADQIAKKLKEKKIQFCLKNNRHWQKAGFEDINHCYKTRHDRPTVESDLLVFHLLFDFTN